jgi:hypothetical protein
MDELIFLDLDLSLAQHIFTLVFFRMVEGEETHDFLQWHGLQRTLMVILFLVLSLVVQWVTNNTVETLFLFPFDASCMSLCPNATLLLNLPWKNFGGT